MSVVLKMIVGVDYVSVPCEKERVNLSPGGIVSGLIYQARSKNHELFDDRLEFV